MMDAGSTPVITVSLVTHNGARWLDGCLASLRAQTLADFELLVVDNASTDDTLRLLRREAATEPRMRLVESVDNLGFAAANNRNIDVARGEFVMLLNQDVELDTGFLAAALAAFEGRPDVGAIQGRLLRLGPAGEHTTVIDSTGLVMHKSRRVVARRQAEHEDARDLIGGPVWGADGPAPVLRRAALLEAREPRAGGGWEILDEDYFMYKEDVDLAWRLRTLGWKAWYEPMALAWHARGAGVGPGRSMLEIARSSATIPRHIKALSWRNQRLMQVKNERGLEFLRDLPWIWSREALSLAFVIVADPLRLASIVKFLEHAPSALRKRRYIGARRSMAKRRK